MRSSILYITLFFSFLAFACQSDTKITVTDVHLEEIVEDSSEMLEPAPPLNNTKSVTPSPDHFSMTAPAGMTFNNWLTRICKNEKPNNSIIAYNFGIFETQTGYMIYLVGSKEFDSKNNDWAANTQFAPQYKYFNLPTNEFDGLNFDMAERKATDMVKNFMKTSTFRNSFFTNAKAITIGFDDGDLVRLK
jgi:hypothetical protein